MKTLVLMFVGAMLVSAADLYAEQPQVFGGLRIAPQGAARASRNSGKNNPYSRLFEPAGPLKGASQARPAHREGERPSVKCGMRLIPSDPRIDPGIVAPTDKSGTKWHVLGVEPSTCW